MPRVIVHLDADAFFASVEQAADSRLRGTPVAVGGEKRGIIASASYEARKFGVYTPMPTVRARKLCPKLIVLPADFDKYEHFSRWMFSYAQDFTPDVEIASIDEGYFDLSAVPKPPLNVADTIRTAIRQALSLGWRTTTWEVKTTSNLPGTQRVVKRTVAASLFSRKALAAGDLRRDLQVDACYRRHLMCLKRRRSFAAGSWFDGSRSGVPTGLGAEDGGALARVSGFLPSGLPVMAQLAHVIALAPMSVSGFLLRSAS